VSSRAGHIANYTLTPNEALQSVVCAPKKCSDYFPYGKILREYVNAEPEKYLTTHHERDRETGLDYRGARYYDSEVARFLSLDPLAVQRASQSPYNYVSGNPISRTDPDGRLDDYYQNAAGEIKWFDNTASEIVDKLDQHRSSL
jgi:RHS repeat-associated protein